MYGGTISTHTHTHSGRGLDVGRLSSNVKSSDRWGKLFLVSRVQTVQLWVSGQHIQIIENSCQSTSARAPGFPASEVPNAYIHPFRSSL